MEFYKEVVWYWYIFENRTLEDTYKSHGPLMRYVLG